MLRYTSNARDHLVRVRREKGLDDTAIPRFIRRTGRLALTFVPAPLENDLIVDDGQLSALVAPSAADLMEATIDVATRGDRRALVVRRGRPGGSSTASPGSTSAPGSRTVRAPN